MSSKMVTECFAYIENGALYFELESEHDSHTLDINMSATGCPSITASFNSLTEDNLIALAKLINDHLNKTEGN